MRIIDKNYIIKQFDELLHFLIYTDNSHTVSVKLAIDVGVPCLYHPMIQTSTTQVL